MNDRNGYTERVQRVVDHLAEHLDDVLDLEALARVACFSPYPLRSSPHAVRRVKARFPKADQV